MTFYKTLAAAGAIAIAVVSPATAETVLKLATAAPQKTPWGAQIMRLADAIAEESEGRLKVEPYFNSQLGTENDTLAQLARGRIEMGLFTVSAGAQQAPEVGLMQLYGLYDSTDQRACVQDNYLTDKIRERLSPKGVYFGTWAEVGNGYFFAKEPITSVEQLKGMKVGISVNKINTEYWKAVGANPVPVSPGEAASGASTGLIEMYPTVYSFYIPSGLNKIIPVVSEYNYSNGPAMFAVSQRTLDSMSEEDQAAINRAFDRFTSKEIMDEIFAFEDKMREIHIASGGEIVQVSEEFKNEMSAMLPPFWATMTAEYGDVGAEIMALVQKAKAECGN
ncbi:TRAP transporter substrate-binding protein [Ruegeria marina]|uniref:TRAP-type C4-dicarboxylate transport system, substrate-binding protein n=1 Tax=Ruegeria marina TaxID=639004 RepID=A0A1G7ECG4_9RHOB|nr:TRAP transporter substrate-binding protein [Ruegeria marina]SDE61332.1 TRAP-type C4-dicarboxylate transport system, substrate-binding protein [Ruegeria marina]